MPSKEALQLLTQLEKQPDLAKTVNWDEFAKDEPDVDVDEIKRDLGITSESFMGNLGEDVKQTGKGLVGMAAMLAGTTNPQSAGVAAPQLFDVVKKMPKSVYDSYKELAQHPLDTAYKKPLTTLLNVAGVVLPAAKGINLLRGGATFGEAAAATGKAFIGIPERKPLIPVSPEDLSMPKGGVGGELFTPKDLGNMPINTAETKMAKVGLGGEEHFNPEYFASKPMADEAKTILNESLVGESIYPESNISRTLLKQRLAEESQKGVKKIMPKGSTLPGKLSSESGGTQVNIEDLRQGREILRRVLNRVDVFGRPSQKIAASPKDYHVEEVFNSHVADADTYGRNLWGSSNVAMSGVPISEIRSQLKNTGDAAFWTRYEKGISQPTKELEKLEKAWTEIQSKYAEAMESVGLKTRKERYAPHEPTDIARQALVTQKGDVWEALMQYLKERLVAEGKDPNIELQAIKDTFVRNHGNTSMVVTYGNVDNPRILNLPFDLEVNGRIEHLLETDPIKAIEKYTRRASHRIGIVSSFGKGTEVIDQIKGMATDFNTRNNIESIWKVLQGADTREITFASRKAYELLGEAEAIFRTQQLSASTLANLFGVIQPMQKFGIRNTLVGMTKPLLAKMKNLPAQQEMRILESWNAFERDVLEGLAASEGMMGKAGNLGHEGLKYVGMNQINRYINQASAVAALRSVEQGVELARQGKTGLFRRIYGGDTGTFMRQMQRDFYFTEAETKDIIKNGFTDFQRARVAQRASAITNAWKESVLDRPLWMRNPVMQRIMAYSSFPRIVGNITKRSIEEASHGNLKPLAMVIAGGYVSNKGIQGMRSYILNQEKNSPDFWDNVLEGVFRSNVLGVWGQEIQNIMWAIRKGENPATTLVPPVVESATAQGAAGIQAIKSGEPSKLTREVVKRTPLLNMVASQANKMLNPKEAARTKEEERVRYGKTEYKKLLAEALMSDNKEKVQKLVAQLKEDKISLTNSELNEYIKMKYKNKAKKYDVWQYLRQKPLK